MAVAKSFRSIIVVWLDSEVNKTEENLSTQQRLFDKFGNVEVFEDADSCQKFIESKRDLQIFLIVSGRLCRKIVPAIDRLEHVAGIYIYCMNKSNHEEWARGFDKINEIIVEIDRLFTRIQTDVAKLETKHESTTYSTAGSKSTLVTETSNPYPQASDSVGKQSSILDGYEKLPLVSLEEAVQPFKDIVTEVDQMVWTAKQNCQKPEEGLTCDESASISVYTMEWYPKESSLSYILNEILRSENKQQIKPWFLYLRLIFHALSKLKTVNRIVYQGFLGDVKKNYSTGKTFTTWEFSNCTSSIKSLEDDEDFGKTGERTLLTIECQSGKDITRHAFDPSKEQVLFSPGCQFKVISCLQTGDELNIVQVEEIKSPYSFVL
ncbi:hypothetical protein I4U23_012487 [Adineta vaga]|nr:hypothetical protein I4U23_012487 [Adineta vaga]